MTEWSDFILTEINGYYNSNDRWKFILFFIRRENDLSKLVKHVKKGVWKVNETKIKVRETNGDHQGYIE